MKFLQFLLYTLIISYQIYSQDIVVIQGKVLSPKSNTIFISKPVNEISTWSFEKAIPLDKVGNFYFEYKTSMTGFYYARHEIAPFYNVSTTLLLNPGDSCYLVLDTKNRKVTINCNNNQDGILLYDKICKQHDEIRYKQKIKQQNEKNNHGDYRICEIKDTLIECMESDLNEIDSLFRTGKIKPTFHNIVSKDISYFYGALYYDLVGHIVFMSQLPDNHPQHIELSDESLHLADSTLSQIFSSFETSNPKYSELKNVSNTLLISSQTDFSYSSEYLNILEQYIHYKGYYVPQRNKSFDIDKLNRDFHKFNLQLYAQNLKGKDFEFTVGQYFFTWFHKPNLAEGLVKPYNSFKKYYPINPFIPYIDTLAKEYKNYDDITTTNFSENYTFIPNPDSINDFKTLLRNFNSKTIYIDIWATTCPPCLKEFEYYKDLYQFFSTNGMEILFISFDKPSDSVHWKKIIKKYNLVGYHILANDFLKKDIQESTKMIGIPWYCIKRNDGDLSKEFINRPSSKEKLYNQINKYIDE